MAEPLLQRIHAEIRARLREAEPAVREYTRLETALAALDGVPPPIRIAIGPLPPHPRQPVASVGGPVADARRLVRGRCGALTGLLCSRFSLNVPA